MKKIFFTLLITASLFGYNVKEFVTCKDIENLTPVKITDIFTTKDKKVYAFAYFTDIKQNNTVDFVWEKEVDGKWKLYADIKLPVFPGSRWRTYSNITIRNFFNGNWRVSIIDGNITVKTVYFKIKDLNTSE
jgi:hypothetical protein